MAVQEWGASTGVPREGAWSLESHARLGWGKGSMLISRGPSYTAEPVQLRSEITPRLRAQP